MTEVRKVNLKELQILLQKHCRRLLKVSGLTPGDVKVITQDLYEVLGGPLPERVAGLMVRVLDLSPAGGRKWMTGWLERIITKIEVTTASGLQELEAGYVALLLEPSRLPGEWRTAAE